MKFNRPMNFQSSQWFWKEEEQNIRRIGAGTRRAFVLIFRPYWVFELQIISICNYA